METFCITITSISDQSLNQVSDFMDFEKPQIDRTVVRDEIIAQLKVFDISVYTLPSTPELFHKGYPQGRGHKVDKLLEDVYNSLVKSEKVPYVPDQSGSIPGKWQIEVFNSYFIHGMIFEEFMNLVREGILVLGRIKNSHSNTGSLLPLWPSRLSFDPNYILITEYGASVLAEHQTLPYFADEYIRLLVQTTAPDDELIGYLSEGLACLHNNLSRAALILLRLPCEHILQKLIEATEAKLSDNSRASEFRKKINRASTNLEKRANVVFEQLEADTALLANETHLKARLLNELKPIFHNIREFAGNAAHKNVPVNREQVRQFYGLFASIIYPVAMKIIQHIQLETTS
jgi:hypothetical protein